jgi:polysaccharide pyruvyl transferase WcaK-like protein
LEGVVRIGLWGTFDVENYGDALFPMLARGELLRRLPNAAISAFGLVGDGHPNRFDGRTRIEALGAPTPERLEELASRLDLVVVGGGEIVHTRDREWASYYPITADEAAAIAPSRFFIDGLGEELEEECPVVWHAVGLPFDVEVTQAGRFRRALAGRPHVSVRDAASLGRLRAAGVAREIAVVPDPAILLPRLYPPEVLATRIHALRAEEAYPREDRVLLVQGSRAHVPHAADLAEAIAEVCGRIRAAPLVVETGACHGDHEFAAALAGPLPESRRLGPAGLVDLTAAIAGSVGFIGVSLHGNIAALAYGRPNVLLGMSGETKLTGLSEAVREPDMLAKEPADVPEAFMAVAERGPREEEVRELGERADAQFDAIAEVARRAGDGRPRRAPAWSDPLRAAYRERGRRLVAQRWRLADRLARTEEELATSEQEGSRLRKEISRLEDRERELEAEVSGKQGELDRLMATRTFRYTAALRRAYGKLRAFLVRR